MTLLDHLNLIEQRLNAATPGPWIAEPNPMRDDGLFIRKDGGPLKYYVGVKTLENNPIPIPNASIINCQVPYRDAEFIAHSPTDIRRLIDACRVMYEALEFECGNRCAQQNICNAKDALAAAEKIFEK